MSYTFGRLLTSDGSWQAFEDDWRKQCEDLEEDFDAFASPTFEVVKDLVENENRKAGLFALKENDSHVAITQLNCATIPNYREPVLRARFITLSPTYDLTDVGTEKYSELLIELLFQVIRLGTLDRHMGSRHVKFHLRSPADRPFFTAFGREMGDHPYFESIRTVGQWLYISKAN